MVTDDGQGDKALLLNVPQGFDSPSQSCVYFCTNFERKFVMKLVNKVAIARPVKVIQNSTNEKSQRWGQIKDAKTGEVLHTGQLGYIVRTARKRYNVAVTLA